MRNTLEQQKSFPVIAWVLVIGLAVLTYYLAITLTKKTDELEASRTQTEAALEHDLRYDPIEY